jgi:hypothetical protein
MQIWGIFSDGVGHSFAIQMRRLWKQKSPTWTVGGQLIPRLPEGSGRIGVASVVRGLVADVNVRLVFVWPGRWS